MTQSCLGAVCGGRMKVCPVVCGDWRQGAFSCVRPLRPLRPGQGPGHVRQPVDNKYQSMNSWKEDHHHRHCLCFLLFLLLPSVSSLGRHSGYGASELCEVNTRTKVRSRQNIMERTDISSVGAGWRGLPHCWQGAVRQVL